MSNVRTGSFFREFIKSPKTVGAIAPSSQALAHMMLTEIDFGSTQSIVEYGAGTGSFTGEIALRMSREADFLAFEMNTALCKILQGKHPEVNVIEKSVLDLPEVLQSRGLEKVDHIVSGLPFAVFSKEDQENIISMSAQYLSEGGTFRTFAYIQGTLLPAGIRFRKLLNRHFSVVRKTPVVWNNLPPAFVYVCNN